MAHAAAPRRGGHRALPASAPTRTLEDLRRTLARLDSRGYKAYRDIKGSWTDGRITLRVEHVQGDPFATPSRLAIDIPGTLHGIPDELWPTGPRRIALCDLLLRAAAEAARGLPRVEGLGNSGRIVIDAGGAEILDRCACRIDAGGVRLRLRVGLPARGRSILGHAAARLLVEHLPAVADRLRWSRLDRDAAWSWVRTAEDHDHLQASLRERGLVAFIADGSILPRASGVSSRPLEGAVPFVSPDPLRVTLTAPNAGEVSGMGLPEGITLITGGGFHGKSTLLQAIQLGVYPHVPGDGREGVVTRADTVKVRSEDGRSVAGVDLRAFIHDLPGGVDTSRFTTGNASGSTSLAAAILESLEQGAGALLLDEDTSATNLLIRDARMQALVRKETITPLVDRVRELRDTLGVSTVLVVGGSGDTLDVADRVILMEDYRPRLADEQARRIVRELPTGRAIGDPGLPFRVSTRRALARSFDPRRGRREKIAARGVRELVFGEETIDLSALEQLVDDSQARAIGVLLRRLREAAVKPVALRELVARAVEEAAAGGLERLDPAPELALPRAFELAGAVNRLRSLEVEPFDGEPPAGS